MKNRGLRRGLALALGLALVIQTAVAAAPAMSSYAYTERTGVVRATTLNVRSSAGTSSSIVGKLSSNAKVTIMGETTGSDGKLWYQIRFTGTGGAQVTGYVSADYIKFPTAYTTEADFEAYLAAQGFPESYKDGLRQLHAQFPNWVFTAKHTGLDWNTVIQNEALVGRNLVDRNSVSSWKSTADGAYDWNSSSWPGFDGNNWVAASEDIIRYYMDPRNFFDEIYVFQFLSQEYDGSIQTREGLVSMVQNTFLSGNTDSTGVSGYNQSTSGGAAVNNQTPSGGNVYDPSQYGPGVSGSSGKSQTSGGGPGGSGSGGPDESSGSAGAVSLEGPVASVAPKDRLLLGDSQVALEAPGQDSGNGQSGGAAGPGGSGASGPGVTGSSALGGSAQSPAAGEGAPQAESGASPGGSDQGASSAPASGSKSYVDIIMDAGVRSGVNPYVLAAMIRQEQGDRGTSPLISGTYSGYAGYYNFFNVEAYQSGSMSAIQRGLWYASQSGSYGRPWNTVEKSILGGAQNYGDNYVKAGQSTFYLKKFNVQGSNLYKHQYMTNIQGAASEGAKLAQAYSDELKKTALEFFIPVFTNMPEQPCVKPTLDGSPNNRLSGLSVDGFDLTPSFNKDTLSYDLIVNTSVTSINVRANTADASATVSGAGAVGLTGSSTDVRIAVRAQNGSLREYVIHVRQQGNGPAGNGQTGGAGSVVVAPDGGQNNAQTSSGGGSSAGPGGSGGPGALGGPGIAGDSGAGPGGSNVTVVQ